MTSQLNVDTIVDKAGSGGTNVKVANTSTFVSDGGTTTPNTVQALAKMWCIFNGTSTVAILDSVNSASLTDNGTGEYAVNYTNTFSSADKYVSFMSADENNSSNFCRIGTLQAQAASSGKVICSLASDCAVKDCARVHKMNHGELA